MPDNSVLKRCNYKKHKGPNPLPLSQFNLDSSSPDKRQRRCRACNKIYLRVRKEKLTGKPVTPRS